MIFDASTLREELAALEKMIPQTKNKTELVNRYVIHARRLRQMEYDENGYVSSRNSTTGY